MNSIRTTLAGVAVSAIALTGLTACGSSAPHDDNMRLAQNSASSVPASYTMTCAQWTQLVHDEIMSVNPQRINDTKLTCEQSVYVLMPTDRAYGTEVVTSHDNFGKPQTTTYRQAVEYVGPDPVTGKPKFDVDE